MVRAAIKSSVPKNQVELLGSPPAPKAERPSARRMMVSKCSKAAVVTGVDSAADSSESSVAVDGVLVGRCVARNM